MPCYTGKKFESQKIKSQIKPQATELLGADIFGTAFEDSFGAEEVWDREIEKYKEAIRINSDDAEAHCNLGEAYYKQNLYNKAIAEHKKAIRINHNYADAHCGLGGLMV